MAFILRKPGSPVNYSPSRRPPQGVRSNAGGNFASRLTFDDAGKRLSRLFLTQLMVNAGFGVVIGCGRAATGVPSALLWGTLVLGELSQVSSPLADIKGSLLADEVETSLRGICRLCLQFAEKRDAARDQTHNPA
ncbi:hypothetical protein [Bosea sp. ASV33]|uniref:hypothetical protein n=1 Tax=Bosea sp. ASV33 TaxID=2795106 RepID=UPI0018EB8923|nr:hypothetical protein [Bosea sp. ASV33]